MRIVAATFGRLAGGDELVEIATIVAQKEEIEEEGLIMPEHMDELLATYDEDGDGKLTLQEFEACVNLYQ